MRARCVSRSHLTLPRRRRRKRKWFDGWDPRDVTRRILVKQTRLDGNSKFNTSSSIPLPRPRLCARVTQCHCDSAEILMEYRERSNDGANVLHYCPLLSFLPITVPIKGGGIHRFFSFFLSLFFFSSFAWVDMQGRRTTTFADVIFNQRDPFSPATRLAGETLPFRCSSRGKDFPRDILRGRRYVSFRSVEGEMVSTK